MIQLKYSSLLLLGFMFFHIQVHSQVAWPDGMSFDLGNVSRGIEVQVNVPFQNTGTFPILIDNIRTPCGCAIPSWNYDPILPLMNDTITIFFTPKGKGMTNKTLKVYFKEIKKPFLITLTAKAI